MPDKEKSIVWVVAMLMLVVAAFGWGFMAANFAMAGGDWDGVRDDDLRRDPGFATDGAFSEFVVNGIVQLPNFFGALRYNLQNVAWLPIAILVVEILLIAGGIWMRRLDRELRQPARRKRPPAAR